MKFEDIINEINKGRLVVWRDDGQSEQMNEKYMKENFVSLARDMEEAAKICRDLQDFERDRHGRALTRLRITGAFDDYVCPEDTDEEVGKYMKGKPPINKGKNN